VWSHKPFVWQAIYMCKKNSFE